MAAEKTIRVRGRFLGSNEVRDVELCDGKVLRIAKAGRGKAHYGGESAIIAPGLFDIQVNGAYGIDLQDGAITAEKLWTISQRLRRHAVTQWMPTIITGPLDAMEDACAKIAKACAEHGQIARAIPGIHLEGPWISPDDGPRGAHPRAHVRKPALKDFQRLQKAANGMIRYITLAPDLPGALPFIRHITDTGVRVSLGHHKADAEHIAGAADAGAVLCTHLGNGISSNIHRHRNPIWPQLAEDRLAISVIADLIHLPAEILRVFARVKGRGRVIIVSDTVHLAGNAPGVYELFGTRVEVHANGKIGLLGSDLFAGSGHFLLSGVENAARHTDLGLEGAWEAASATPAKLLGFELPAALPRVGRKSDFAVYTPAPRATAGHLDAVFVENKLAYPKPKS
jgi:N-acetylglucosamine-6-phosphate deacetylase